MLSDHFSFGMSGWMPRSRTGQFFTSCWPGGRRLPVATAFGFVRPNSAMCSLPLMSFWFSSSMAGSVAYPGVDFEGVFGFDAGAFLGIRQANGAHAAKDRAMKFDG